MKGPIATVCYLDKIIFNRSPIMNDLDTPYLVVHQYDKRWMNLKTVENTKKIKLKFFMTEFWCARRFEPSTSRSEVRRSIQLSYERIIFNLD